MSRIPEPDKTPQGPAYEGRLLDRPDEEVVDQGAAFDLRTLVSRRRVLGLVGIGAGALLLAACASASTASTGSPTPSSSGSSSGSSGGEIPDETAGPYPGDGSNGPDVLAQSGVVRSDIRSSIDGGGVAEGVPLTFTFTVLDMAHGDVPFAGVAVYAWHCDAQGRYSMYSEGVEDETFLRGVQVTDASGKVTFTSIYPGCYSGRWPHIHFEVYPDLESVTDSSNAIATSQLAFDRDISEEVYAVAGYEGSLHNLADVGSLANDNVFGDDGGELQLGTFSGSVSGGYASELTVRVDTRTTPTTSGTTGNGMAGAGGR